MKTAAIFVAGAVLLCICVSALVQILVASASGPHVLLVVPLILGALVFSAVAVFSIGILFALFSEDSSQ